MKVKAIFNRYILLRFFSNRVKKNIIKITGTQLIVSVFLMVTSIIWARYYPIETFAKFNIVLSILGFVSILAYSGMRHSITISAGKGLGGNFLLIIKEKFFISILLIPVILIFAYYYHNDDDIFSVLLLFAILLPLYTNQGHWEAWLLGGESFNKYSLYKIASTVIFAVVLFLLHDLESVFILISLLIIFKLIVNLIFTFDVYKNKGKKSIDKSVVSYGKKVTGALLLNSLLMLDKLIIEFFIGMESVAIYVIALLAPGILRMVFDTSCKLIIPKIVKFDSVLDAWTWFKFFFWKIVIIYLIVGIFGFLIMELLILVVFGSVYSESSLYSSWLFLFTALALPFSYISQILIYQKKTDFIYMFTNTNIIVKLGGFIILIPIYELWGVVITFFVNYIINIVVILKYFLAYIEHDKKKAPPPVSGYMSAQ